MTYTAPVKDMMFVLKELAGIDAVAQLPGMSEAGEETAAAVLEECARFNQEVVAPLNWTGDIQPSSLANGVVTTTPGFRLRFSSLARADGRACNTRWSLAGRVCPS
jgi:3-(methylthio)propanoyl-CoA dehydrogenase